MECQIPISSANRVLCRLYKKGMVSRYEPPMLSSIHCRPKVTPWLPFKATRMLSLSMIWSVASALEG